MVNIASDLLNDAFLLLSIEGLTEDGFKKLRAKYPKNDWGAALLQFDVFVRHFKNARLETKEQCIRRDDIMRRFPEKNGKINWDDWHKDNPQLPTIQYNPVLYIAAEHALKIIQEPPENLRKSLEKLAAGKNLNIKEIFFFVQSYVEFISAVEVMFARDATIDELEHERKAWNVTNKERWDRYAAQEINKILIETPQITIKDARDIFAVTIKDNIEKQRIPSEWTIEEYKEFLGADDKIGTACLKKRYAQNLTLPKIKKILEKLV